MLKKFFTVFLGSMAAIWFSTFLLVGFIFMAVALLMGDFNKDKVETDSVLYFDFSGEITERFEPPTLPDVIMGNEKTSLSLEEIEKALRMAATDNNIKGVYIRLDGSSIGMAMRQELNALFQQFKKSGKWIVAYADNYSQGDFYTACVADQVFINPSGSLAATGLSATVPFFKNALDKLGVEVQVIKVGTFKSAVEPFILTAMSDSARMMYDVMLNTMWTDYVDSVVKNRNIEQGGDSMFRQMAATPMIAFTADELIEAKLFDNKYYGYQVDSLLKKKAGVDDKKLNLVGARQYLSSFTGPDLGKLMEESDHVAVLYAVGDIVDSGNDGIVGDKMAPLIAQLADDEKVKGLVLRVNSGGGSAFASEQIWASLEYFKSKGKPFVVSMSDAAASGGYYISCGADKIYADPSTITGSIGIFGIIPYAKVLLNDKLGINFDVVETNPNTVLGRLDAPLTPAQHTALEKNIKDGYDLFISRVAAGRHMEDAAVRRIAEGRVWAGQTAMQLGLVDEMGALSDAVNYVLGKTGLSIDDCVAYPEIKLTPLEMLLSIDSANASVGDAAATSALKMLGLTPTQIHEIQNLSRRVRDMGAVQAKMEDIRVY